MNELVQTTRRTPSTISADGLGRAISVLDTEQEINSRTQLLPVEVCEQIVRRIDAEPRRCPQAEATELVAMLLRNYPEFKAHDAKGYTMALFELFSAYPKSIGTRVVDTVTGLPSRLKYTPKAAEVSEALVAEIKRRDLIRANALSHKRERDRRDESSKAEREFQAGRPSVERRRQQVAELLKPFRQSP